MLKKLPILMQVLTLMSMPFMLFSQQNFHDCSNHQNCNLQAKYEVKDEFTPPPSGFEYGGDRDVVISVTYNGFTPEAQTAFQYAVDIWASLLDSDVPILIDAYFEDLGEGTLGSAGPVSFYTDFAGAPEPGTFYPVALANKIAGFDLDPGDFDISASFNSNFDWYYGTDGNPAFDEFDFVSVVLHELGHGLGFVGSAEVSGSTGSYGFSGDPIVFDQFTETNTGMDILSFSNNSTSLGNALTGGNVFWFGTNAVTGNLGSNPEMYAPGTWEPGSSYSHWDEDYYPEGDSHSLMTPFLAFAEAVHDPGEVTLGMMEDIGWTVNETSSGGCDILDVTFTQQACQDLGGGLLPVFTMEFDIFGDCFIEDVWWDDGTGYVTGNLPDAGIFVYDGDGFNLINTVEDATYEIYFVLSDGTISDTYIFNNGNCSGEILGCTNEYASNYNPSATVEDGSCTYDETICDCAGTEHTIGVLVWVGDGFEDIGGTEFLWDGQTVDFNCADWGYDCGDIIGSPDLDPFNVCSGGLPPNNGCPVTGDCEFGSTIVYVDGCVAGTDVMFFQFDFTGACTVDQICAVSTFDTQEFCFDVSAQSLESGEIWGISELDLGTWEFYYTLSDGSTSPSSFLTIESCVETFGCTNPYATNYNPSADTDDGSCVYNEIICDCAGTEHTIGVLTWLGDGFADDGAFMWDGQFVDFECDTWGYDCGDIIGSPDSDPYNVCLGGLPPDNGCTEGCTGVEVTISIITDCWGEEVAWTLSNDGGDVIASVDLDTYGYEETYNTVVCLTNDCYTFEITDEFGDGMFGSQYIECTTDGYYIITDEFGNELAEMITPDYGFGTSHDFCIEAEDVEGCTDFTACNYDPNATLDDGSCDFSCYGCTSPAACNYDATATLDDGSCDFSCYGCTDVTACNYDSEATIDNGSCEYLSCVGCTDPGACNFDPTATIDNGSCDYTCLGCTDFAACNFDPGATVNDGSCDYSCYGCTDETACNYDPEATIENGSCNFLCYGCTDEGACNYDPEATIGNGTCDYSCLGCTNPEATNYDPEATIDDGSCIIEGCTDEEACNYNPEATDDDDSCEYTSCLGCTDEEACNYDPEALIDDDSCEYETCAGCTDEGACNYDSEATIDDGSCEYETCAGCTDEEACNYDPEALIDDGSCDYETCAGCTDPLAINYDPEATFDDGSCIYDCEYPIIEYETYCEDGDDTGFYIEMTISNLGNGAPYTISNNQNDDEISLSFLGTINIGPFENNETVLVTVQSNPLSGCFITSPVLSDDCTVGVEELATVDFEIFPNPTDGIINLKTINYSGWSTVSIYDLSGRLVLNSVEYLSSSTNLIINKYAQLADGSYIVEVTTSAGTSRKQIVVNK